MPTRVPSAKLKKAARLLLFKSHFKPGVKGWELSRALGEGYLDVIRALDSLLRQLGLRIIAVDEKGERLGLEGDGRRLRKALFLTVLDEPPTIQEAKTSGWRIDDLAILATSLLYLLSRGGKAKRRDLVELLKTKFRSPRLGYTVERLVKLGYLEEEEDTLAIGWRSKVEVDLNRLVGVYSQEDVSRN